MYKEPEKDVDGNLTQSNCVEKRRKNLTNSSSPAMLLLPVFSLSGFSFSPLLGCLCLSP